MDMNVLKAISAQLEVPKLMPVLEVLMELLLNSNLKINVLNVLLATTVMKLVLHLANNAQVTLNQQQVLPVALASELTEFI